MATGKRITSEAALRLAGKAGQRVTEIVRGAVFGARPRAHTSGDTAYSNQSAQGIGPRSVYDGPARSARPGEPILRRAKR